MPEVQVVVNRVDDGVTDDDQDEESKFVFDESYVSERQLNIL